MGKWDRGGEKLQRIKEEESIRVTVSSYNLGLS